MTKAVVPPTGTPTGAAPTGFTVHVECDDGTSVDVTFPAGGGAGTPAQIDDIDAGSTATVTETGTDGFPPGTAVSYAPAGANTVGVTIDLGETVTVTVTNAFASLEVGPDETAVEPAAAAVVVAPRTAG